MGEEIFNSNSGTKKIAINTIIVYARLFVVTIIGLLTSRFVLQAVGVSDYGLYNVVGGVISLFSVVSGSLATTTIRFLNIEIGKKDGDPNKLFNICNVIHIVFAIILLLAAETIGIWYIHNYLNVESGKEADAMFVFQVSTIVACLGLINIPYSSTFIAKEKFGQIALVDIANALIKFLSVVILLSYTGNVLRLYALLMSLTTLFSFIVYHALSYRQWYDLVRWKFVSTMTEYKKVLVYNNYNILATISLIIRSQGSNMLINFFFGTLVNGAYAIARTVQGFVESFMANFDSAAAPKIIQNVGAGEKQSSEYLVHTICRYCILMMILVFFPLMVETEFVLKIWLVRVPDYSVQFVRMLLVVILVASTAGGMLQYINASGKIKWFKIIGCLWTIIVLPIGYFIFKIGFEAYWIFLLFVISDLLKRVCQLYLMNKILEFDSFSFVQSAYIRPFFVTLLMSLFVFSYHLFDIQNDYIKFIGILLTFFITLLCIWIIGLTQTEKTKIIKILKFRFRRLN